MVKVNLRQSWDKGRVRKYLVKDKISFRDDDYFDMFPWLGKIIAESLKEFKAGSRHGHTVFSEEDLAGMPEQIREIEDDEARWEAILDEMIWAFDQAAKDDSDMFEVSRQERLQREERADIGRRLFADYFLHLWD